MKKIILMVAAAMLVLASCNKPTPKPTPVDPLDPVEWGGFTYHPVQLGVGGPIWLEEPLQYLPAGETASLDPAADVLAHYPYTIIGGVATPTDYAPTVEKLGYLYNVAKVAAIDTKLCPEGYHIPTTADAVALVGYKQSNTNKDKTQTDPEILDESAFLYNKEYKGAMVYDFVNLFNVKELPGCIAGGKYSALAVKDDYGTAEAPIPVPLALVGRPALSYILVNQVNTLASSPQHFALMTTFNKTYPMGRMHISNTNDTNSVQIRCVRDADPVK